MKQVKRKTRIFIMGADNKPGGVAGYVNTILSFSNHDKYEFHMTVSENQRLDQSFNNNQNRVIKHIFPVTYSFWSLPVQAYQLRILLKKTNIDLLHLHTARAGFLGVIAGTGLPVGIVYTGHSWRFEQKTGLILKILFYLYERCICNRADIVTFLTQRDKNLGIRRGLVNSKKAVIINTRINTTLLKKIDNNEIVLLRHRLGIPENAVVIGNTGYLSSRKDPLTFVRAAARIMASTPNAFFLWVGDGEEKDEVINLADNLGLGERLIITGFVPPDEVPRLLQAMDVFLFTSQVEGIPLSIIEAQAMQLPIVSSDYAGSGLEELIIHGWTGYVFPLGDDEKAALYVLSIIRDRETASLMRERASDHFLETHSSPEKMAQEYEEVYEKSLENFQRKNGKLN